MRLLLCILAVVEGDIMSGLRRKKKALLSFGPEKKAKRPLMLKKSSRISGFADDSTADDCDIYMHKEECFDAHTDRMKLHKYDFSENKKIKRALESAISVGNVSSCTSCGFNDDVYDLGPLDCATCDDESELMVVWEDCTGICVPRSTSFHYEAAGFARLEESACTLYQQCYDDIKVNGTSGENDFFLSLEIDDDLDMCHIYSRLYCNQDSGTLYYTNCGNSDTCTEENDACAIGFDLGISEITCQENDQSAVCDGNSLIVTDCDQDKDNTDYGETGFCYYESCGEDDYYDYYGPGFNDDENGKSENEAGNYEDENDTDEQDRDTVSVLSVKRLIVSSFTVQGISLTEAVERQNIFIQAVASLAGVHVDQVSVEFSCSRRRRLQEDSVVLQQYDHVAVDYEISVEDTMENIESLAAQMEEVDDVALEEALAEAAAAAIEESANATVFAQIDVVSVDEVQVEDDTRITTDESSSKKEGRKAIKTFLIIIYALVSFVFLLFFVVIFICCYCICQQEPKESPPERPHLSADVVELVPGKS